MLPKNSHASTNCHRMARTRKRYVESVRSTTRCGEYLTLHREFVSLVDTTIIRLTQGSCWGWFSVTALAYQKGALISAPRHKHKTPKHDVHQDTWHPYPLSSDVVKSHRECLFTALCDIGEIIHDLSLSLFKDNNQTLDTKFAQLAEELHSRLRAWYEGMPDCLAIPDAPPHVLSLQSVPASP